jgi:hypothetical protein
MHIYPVSVEAARRRAAGTGDRNMPDWNSRLIAVVAALFLTGLSEASYATEQAQQRRAGRDVRQETRHGARHTKQDCRAANQQSNSQCRQDKRQTKQNGRQAARNIKY